MQPDPEAFNYSDTDLNPPPATAARVDRIRDLLGLITEEEAAEVVGEKARTWQSRRLKGEIDKIPPFIRIGHRTFYALPQLKAWIDRQIAMSASTATKPGSRHPGRAAA